MKIYKGQPHHDGEWPGSRSGIFIPRKEPRHPLSERLGVSQSRSGRALRNRRELRSTELFHIEKLSFLTDVSGQPIGPIFRGQVAMKK